MAMENKTRSRLRKSKPMAIAYNTYLEIRRLVDSDEKHIRKAFKHRTGRELDLENPQRYNDKIQWLKLNWRDRAASKWADKYKARELVSGLVGKQYLNELIGVYKNPDKIDFDILPQKFVLKCNLMNSIILKLYLAHCDKNFFILYLLYLHVLSKTFKIIL